MGEMRCKVVKGPVLESIGTHILSPCKRTIPTSSTHRNSLENQVLVRLEVIKDLRKDFGDGQLLADDRG